MAVTNGVLRPNVIEAVMFFHDHGLRRAIHDQRRSAGVLGGAPRGYSQRPVALPAADDCPMTTVVLVSTIGDGLVRHRRDVPGGSRSHDGVSLSLVSRAAPTPD